MPRNARKRRLPKRVFGVFNATTPTHFANAKAAGFTHVLVEVSWASAQPSGPNTALDSTYMATIQTRIANARAAGLHVQLQAAFHYSPSWIDTSGSAIPKFVNQFGTAWSDTSTAGRDIRDWVWTATGRTYVADFITRVIAAVDLGQIASMRCGTGWYGENQYPPGPGGGVYHWWGFGPGPQSGTDLAAGMAVCPWPAYVPYSGDSTKDAAWIAWYLSSQAKTVAWLIQAHRTAWWVRDLFVLQPGFGLRSDFATTAAGYKDAASLGQDWDGQVAQYAAQPRTHIHCTWIDGTHPWADDLTVQSDQASWYRQLQLAKSLGSLGPSKAQRMSGENSHNTWTTTEQAAVFQRGAIPQGYRDFWDYDYTGLAGASGSTASLASTAALIAATPAAPAHLQPEIGASGMNFITRSGSSLWDGTARFRFFGANAYWLGLNDNTLSGGNATFPNNTIIDGTFAQLVALGATVARVHTLGISVGHVNTIRPDLSTWGNAAFEQADYVIWSARRHGIRLMIPLVDRWNFYHGGGLSWAGFRSLSTMNDFFTNSTVKSDFKAYISHLLNHINPYTGLKWKDDPTIAIWETGNEIYDAPAAWTSEIAAHIKSITTSQLVADGTAASGMHVSNSAINDANVDVMGGHFYDTQAMDRNWLRTDAAAAVSAGKAYVVGEYDWTDGANNGSTTPTADTNRAGWLTEIETNGNVVGGIMWTVCYNDGSTTIGTHRDGYELYLPVTENSEQAAGAVAFAAHGANMKASSAVAPTDYTGTITDAFTGTNGNPLDPGKWVFLESPNGGAGVADIQSNRGRMLTAATGSYGDKIVLVSQAAARANASIVATLYPQSLNKEAYFSGVLRASTADLSVGDVNCYKFEISTTSGGTAASISVSKKVASTQTVLKTGSAISGAAATQPIFVEFSASGTTLTLRAWTGNIVTDRPSTPTWTGTDSSISAAGRVALVLNGGAATTTVDWRIDDVTVA